MKVTCEIPCVPSCGRVALDRIRWLRLPKIPAQSFCPFRLLSRSAKHISLSPPPTSPPNIRDRHHQCFLTHSLSDHSSIKKRHFTTRSLPQPARGWHTDKEATAAAATAEAEAAATPTASRTGTTTIMEEHAITVREITIPMGKPNGVATPATSVKSTISLLLSSLSKT